MLSTLSLSFVKRPTLSLLPYLARFTFAATLATFLWKSALTKFDGFSLSIGAYAQIFPKAFEAVGYNPSELSVFYKLIAFGGSIGELILPLLIILGLFTRIASLGMIIFILVLSWVDHFGHGLEWGMWFDGEPGSKILDQRFYWITNLLVLMSLGGGRFSLDHLIGIRDEHK